ncbi:hypothetical protein ElyMa_005154400 [Elysia marginata]|uniref:MULE transposase domain-containing protein n=1 Tax=Elysia marginata TaxID=1093978 RepID=A0AAV4JTP7_9GAST|nr:hypothetical protein ElyMa_005154400 [Elysia marginata]
MKDEGLFSADGTFKSSPEQFYQIYTFIGHRKGHYIPMMFLLLPGASKAIYETAFKLFKETFRSQTGSEFLERTLFLDFERAALEGAKSSLPGTALKCCLFHLKKNWYRKIKKCGRSVDYNDEDSSLRQILKMTFGLPFLDFLDIYDSFAFDFYLEAPEDDRLQKFYDYLWASVTVSEKRTTNGYSLDFLSYGLCPPKQARRACLLDFMLYVPAQEDEAHKGGNPRWLMRERGPSANRLLQNPRYLWVLLRHTLSSSARKNSTA